tara:strand:- start:718 stop:1092 length:375 start_codon:yes stop_codon:yes gene_type:complete
MRILVIGSALRSQGFDQGAAGLTFIEEAKTAPKYRLYSLEDQWAALVSVEHGGVSVAGEIVEVPDERWPEILASEPPGVVPGPIELDDGREVIAALGDFEYMENHAVEITQFGSFAAYLASQGS